MKNREKTEENGKLSASSMEHGYGVPVAEFEHITVFFSLPDDEVRLAVAASFHELLDRQPKTTQLLESFVDLIRGGAPEVISKLTCNLDKTLPILYQLAADSNGVLYFLPPNKFK